jgi:hypothetical protein
MDNKDNRSSRTRMIDDAPVENSAFKRGVKSITSAISRGLDRVGITQEKEYKDKTKEELSVKKRSRGGPVSSASKRADGIAQKGKTKGRLV